MNVRVNGVNYCVAHHHEGAAPCPACADAEARAAFAIKTRGEVQPAVAALTAERDRLRDELAAARDDTALLVRVFGRIAPWRVTGRDVCDVCGRECNPAIGCRHAGAR